jgi:hypothetical protein
MHMKHRPKPFSIRNEGKEIKLCWRVGPENFVQRLIIARSASHLLPAGFFFILLFDCENGDAMFLRKVC